MEFKKQIDNDIELIKRDYSDYDNRLKDSAFAFNFWVLSHLYSVDEDIISSCITERNDKSIDCFVHYEDTKELFIIQNKYYDVNTIVNRPEVSDFLKTPLCTLKNGNYSRSKELQQIFDRIYKDSDYKIWLHFYVTNNYQSEDIQNLFLDFDYSDDEIKAYVGARYFNLNDIQRLYFNDRFSNKISFNAIMPTQFQATSLDVRPKDYNLPWMIPLRYIMLNVAELYKVYKDAEIKNYQLFEENIREYLGTQGINNGIIKTLRSKEDRENFFYYNNGITIICEACETLNANTIPQEYKKNYNYLYGFRLKNPQIVNGCQTINSIAEVLSHYSDEIIYKEFNKTFVLVKIYVFDEETKKQKEGLDKSIVKYTNSQNGISDKDFASKKNYFLNIQNEFLRRGFLLLVKPSDKNTFSDQYSDRMTYALLKKKADQITEKFDFTVNNLNDHLIPLEKLLKVLLSFYKDGYTAFRRGSTVLNPNSPMYKEFSLNIDKQFTIENMLFLYLIFIKAENEKRNGDDKRFPIPYYILSFIGQTFNDKTYEPLNKKLDYLFESKETFKSIYNFYKTLTHTYAEAYSSNLEIDYNVMIKQEIDIIKLDNCCKTALQFYADKEKVNEFIKFN